jgi:V/A-type H+-transporting ATPase subunit K
MLVDPAALATLGGTISLAGGLVGSSWGMAVAGSAGVAMLAQNPRQRKNVIILASLPMSRVFYSFIILILIVNTVSPSLNAIAEPEGAGFAVLAMGIMASVAFAVSGIYQGSVCAAGIAFLAKTNGKILTNSITLAVFVELVAVLGLVFTIIALNILGLM